MRRSAPDSNRWVAKRGAYAACGIGVIGLNRRAVFMTGESLGTTHVPIPN